MISVCMATYNGARFIKEQIDSILPQLAPDDELIISDDGSTDGTVDIIESYSDERIRLLKGNAFHSPIYNLENAMKTAHGDYIFLSDQDDEWAKDKVSVCMEHLKSCDLLVHNAEVVDGDGNRIAESFFRLNHTRNGRLHNLLKNGYIGCCMCFTKRLLESFLPLPRGLPMHDIYIGNYAAFNEYKIRFIDDRLIRYRRHGANASLTVDKSRRQISARLMDRYIIIKILLCKKANAGY